MSDLDHWVRLLRDRKVTLSGRELCEIADEIDILRKSLEEEEANAARAWSAWENVRNQLVKAREALEDLLSDADRQMKNPSHHIPFSYQKAKDTLTALSDDQKTDR